MASAARNIHLCFGLTVLANESLELGMWNPVWRWVINKLTNCVWNVFYM